jgi:Tfp pilus assembly protein FimV
MSSIQKIHRFTCLAGLLLSFTSLSVANIKDAEKALAQLMSDVEKVELAQKSKEENPSHYKTKYGDTLDQIILDYMPNLPIRTAMVKRAIVYANPHAFKRSNPNWMYSGKKIKLPDAEDLKDLIFTDAAQAQMSRGQDRDDWIRFP